MMDRVFDQYHKNRKDPAIKSFKRHQFKIGKAVKDRGDQYPGPKASALKKKAGHNVNVSKDDTAARNYMHRKSHGDFE